ncbi:MAG: DUF4124 domain-containing protein [Gammaproteobacteria bacterium]|nr:DUF4124 domain-containing protein [Gammaproteobacteria bacterium]
MKHILLGVFILVPGLVLAGTSVYRTVDEDGNPVFSDEPSPQAEEINLPEVQTVPAERNIKFETTKSKEDSSGKYKSLAITSPENDEPVRENAGNVTVKVQVKPGLRRQDSLRVYLDSELVKEGRDTSFDLANLERGTHQLTASVVNKEGEEILTSTPVTFHLLREANLDPNLAPDPNVVSPLNPPKPPPPAVSPLNPPKPPPP